jgi:GNAT superfamily N-acetyltransferase
MEGKMDATTERIAHLERVNYLAMRPVVQATPGLDLVLRDDVIMTSSEMLPTPDTTHACLLRATSDTVDDLINEAIAYFESKCLPTTMFISPACTPADLPAWHRRLLRRGFVRREAVEAWMVLEGLSDFEIPPPSPGVAVRQVTGDEVGTFAEIFMTVFGLALDFAPHVARMLEPAVGLPGFYHYIALVGGRPVGTGLWRRYERFGILGGTGVVPAYRGRGVATSLAIRAATEARGQGVDTLMLQTDADTWLERLLSMSGFKRIFTRTGYTLT